MDGQAHITHRNREVLAIIQQHIDDWGYPPTLREIADCLNVHGVNGVRYHLDRLEHHGYIERDAGISRGIRILGTDE